MISGKSDGNLYTRWGYNPTIQELEQGLARLEQAEAALADNLQLFLLATSLGGVESLVSQPCATSHYALSAEERQQRGISDGLLRLSVGLENAEDLIHDQQQALARVFS